jgi:multiple sugar transport system permease protein
MGVDRATVRRGSGDQPSMLFYAFVILVMIPFVFPFIWMILSSLKNELDVLAIPPKIIFEPTLENYLRIFLFPDLLHFFGNSLIIGIGSSLGALVLGLPAAFSIARFRQNKLSLGILVARIIPGMSVLLPWFIWFTQLHMIDTLPAVIFAHMSFTLPLTIWIMISFFEDFPRELEDAALIDGCSLTGCFWRVVLPVMIPGIVVAFLLCFIFSWNNFLLSSILGGGVTKTLPVVAYSQIGFYKTDQGAMAASGIVLTLPVLVLTLLVQRYIVRGLAFGALKG